MVPLRRVIKYSAIIGFMVPMIFTGIFAVIDTYDLYWPDFAMARLYFWPPSIVFLGMAETPNWSWIAVEWIFIAALLNVLIYVGLGTLGWLIVKGVRNLAAH